MLNSFEEENCRSESRGLQDQDWVALSIGNTHWKWGYFEGQHLRQTWITKAQHWTAGDSQGDWQHWCQRSPALQWHQTQGKSPYPLLCLASVVDAEQQVWLSYPRVRSLSRTDIPMAGLYQGLGIDRALAVCGAGTYYGWPVLVIDAGTALTFSAADSIGFQGGAIAPGLGLQLAMLHQHTSGLPHVLPDCQLPPRWAQDTQSAILSGVIFGVLASVQEFIAHWEQKNPRSYTVFTGGDGARLLQWLEQLHPRFGFEKDRYWYDNSLIFKGMAHCLIQV